MSEPTLAQEQEQADRSLDGQIDDYYEGLLLDAALDKRDRIEAAAEDDYNRKWRTR